MDVYHKILKRTKLLSLKLKRQLPYLHWTELIAQCIKRDLKLQTLIKKVDYDSSHDITLYRVPSYNRLLWLPHAEPELIELDSNLALCGYYHGANINSLVKENGVVLDCGGYVGLFALWALAKKASKVVVFEPLERNIECIKRNLSDYINAGRVILIEAGVWNCAGDMEFFEDEGGPGSTFIKDIVYEKSSRLFRDVHLKDIHNRISVVTIDDMAESLKLSSINLIKMDVEGAEPEALLGARNTLVKCFPNLAICTYHIENHPQVINSIVTDINPQYRHSFTTKGSLITCWQN